MTDSELLRLYARNRSDEAFAELVQRHVNLVFSTAVHRLGGDRALAEDAAQLVFISLARNAVALEDHPALSAWLYTASHYTAAKLGRARQRRDRRERKAQSMEAIIAGGEPESDWGRLRPLLDDTLHKLGDRERLIVVLHYFDGHSVAQIAARLGLTESAVRKAMDRVHDRLRILLARQGIESTSAGLAMALSAAPLIAAPGSLAVRINAAVHAGSAGGAGSSLLDLMKLTQLKAAAILVLGTANLGLLWNGAPATHRAPSSPIAAPVRVARAQPRRVPAQAAPPAALERLAALMVEKDRLQNLIVDATSAQVIADRKRQEDEWIQAGLGSYPGGQVPSNLRRYGYDDFLRTLNIPGNLLERVRLEVGARNATISYSTSVPPELADLVNRAGPDVPPLGRPLEHPLLDPVEGMLNIPAAFEFGPAYHDARLRSLLSTDDYNHLAAYIAQVDADMKNFNAVLGLLDPVEAQNGVIDLQTRERLVGLMRGIGAPRMVPEIDGESDEERAARRARIEDRVLNGTETAEEYRSRMAYYRTDKLRAYAAFFEGAGAILTPLQVELAKAAFESQMKRADADAAAAYQKMLRAEALAQRP